MGFQALFIFVNLVLARSGRRRGDCSKQLGRRRRTRACGVPDECAGQTECREQLFKTRNPTYRWQTPRCSASVAVWML